MNLKAISFFTKILFIVFCVNFVLAQDVKPLKKDNYKEVKIGNQIWMTENLSVSKFRNGDTIPQIKSIEEWKIAGEERKPAWCYPDFTSSNGEIYGKYYNWFAVNDPRGLAPYGWHVPNLHEWETLGAGQKHYCDKCYSNDKHSGDDAINRLKMKQVNKIKIYYVEVGGYDEKKWVPCSNCKSWNSEYRRKVPCHACKDERGKYVKIRYVPKTKEKREKEINVGWDGTNETGFSALPEVDYDGLKSIQDYTNFWTADDCWLDRCRSKYAIENGIPTNSAIAICIGCENTYPDWHGKVCDHQFCGMKFDHGTGYVHDGKLIISAFDMGVFIPVRCIKDIE